MRHLAPLIVIPVFNHGATLPDVVRGVLALGYPLLVVDDGSEEDIRPKLASLNCQTLRLEQNQGKGAAILAGAKEADRLGYDSIITLDGDGQHIPADIPLLIAEAQRSSGPVMVIGDRQMVEDTVPRASHFGKHFSNFWVRLECGHDLQDTQSGFRLYPVQELLRLKLRRTRYDFEIEVLVKLAWAGIPVSSVPVRVHYPPGGERISHFHKVKDNARLTLCHGLLVGRRLLPLPHEKLPGTTTMADTVKKTIGRHPLEVLGKICREHTSPLWLSLAVWLGLFMGALPLIACHTIAIIYVAHRFHLNKVAAVAASQFCMPPVVPVLCIQVGYFLRFGEFLVDLSWQRWLLEIHERIFEWLLGSLLMGPVLGLIGAVFVYNLAVRLRERKEKQRVAHDLENR